MMKIFFYISFLSTFSLLAQNSNNRFCNTSDNSPGHLVFDQSNNLGGFFPDVTGNVPAELTFAFFLTDADWTQGNGETFLGKQGSSNGNRQWWVEHRNATGAIAFVLITDPGTMVNRISYTIPSVANTDTVHIAGTWNDATGLMALYVDGVLVNSGTIVTSLQSKTADIYVGTRETSANGVDGKMWDIIVHDTALSATDILSVFNGTYTNSVEARFDCREGIGKIVWDTEGKLKMTLQDPINNWGTQ